MRAKAIDSLEALVNRFVHFNGNDIPLVIKDRELWKVATYFLQ